MIVSQWNGTLKGVKHYDVATHGMPHFREEDGTQTSFFRRTGHPATVHEAQKLGLR